MWYCLTEILTESGTDAAEERECEVDQYLVGPLVDLKSKWWESYHYHYPVLAQLARIYLSAPSTSVNSETVFSGACTGICAYIYSNRLEKIITISVSW